MIALSEGVRVSECQSKGLRMSQNDLTWFDVYALFDPFEEVVFYVGITDDFIGRYIEHVRMRDDNTAKNARVASIIVRGCLPIINRLIKVQGKAGAFDLEALFIEIFRLYKQPLTNRELRVFSNVPARQAIIDNIVQEVSGYDSRAIITVTPVDAHKVVELLKAQGLILQS